jgi:hypothetical protein
MTSNLCPTASNAFVIKFKFPWMELTTVSEKCIHLLQHISHYS